MKDKKEAYILILLTILNLILDINIVYCFKFDFIKYGYIEQTYLVAINKIKIQSKEQKELKILKHILRKICGNLSCF